MNNKGAVQIARMRRLVCAFVIEYGIYRFSHNVAQLTTAANEQPQQNRVCIFISCVISLRPKDPLFQKLFTLGGFSYSDYTLLMISILDPLLQNIRRIHLL